MSKKLLKVYIIVDITIFIMFISMFLMYYFYMNNQDQIKEYKNNLLVTYNNDEFISIDNIIDKEYNYYFSIENIGEKYSEFNIVFDILSPLSTKIDKNFVYKLLCESDNNSVINKNETPIPISSKVIGKGKINKNTKYNCILNIKYNDKESIIDKNFLANIKISTIN